MEPVSAVAVVMVIPGLGALGAAADDRLPGKYRQPPKQPSAASTTIVTIPHLRRRNDRVGEVKAAPPCRAGPVWPSPDGVEPRYLCLTITFEPCSRHHRKLLEVRGPGRASGGGRTKPIGVRWIFTSGVIW